MKELFVKLMIFLLPIVLLAVPLDSFLSKNLKKSNSCVGEFLVWNDIYDGKANADICIYGSSKAWVNFNPKIIEDSCKCNVYNFGIDGHNFWLEYLRHKEILKYNKKPKYILVSLDIFSLEKRADLYNLDQFLPYMLINEDIHQYTSSYKGFSTACYYVPLVRYFGRREAIFDAILCALKVTRSEPMRSKGYRGMEYTWTNDFSKAKSKIKNYTVIIDPASKKLFNQFLEECKKDDITVLLVYSPEYIYFQSFVTNRKEILSLYKDFSVKYNIPLIDYSDDPMCKELKYFYNSTHLNKIGSEIFTCKLVSSLKKLQPFCLTFENKQTNN
jgi:hypothetical protein